MLRETVRTIVLESVISNPKELFLSFCFVGLKIEIKREQKSRKSKLLLVAAMYSTTLSKKNQILTLINRV